MRQFYTVVPYILLKPEFFEDNIIIYTSWQNSAHQKHRKTNSELCWKADFLLKFKYTGDRLITDLDLIGPNPVTVIVTLTSHESPSRLTTLCAPLHYGMFLLCWSLAVNSIIMIMTNIMTRECLEHDV